MYTIGIMVVRMKSTHGHTGNRRSHHALSSPALSKCEKCSTMRLRHRACPNCGTYKKKEYINVLARLEKKQKQQKSKGGEVKEK